MGDGAVVIGEAVVEIGVGMEHSCARTMNGGLYCWGGTIDTGYPDPELGPIVGDDETPQEAGPLPLPASVRALSVHAVSTCGLLETGAVFCWGNGINVEMAEQVQVDSPFIGMSKGGFHTCAFTMGGELYCWGPNASGALGTGTMDEVPASAPAHIELDESVVEVVLVGRLTCVRSETGKVKCWGRQGTHGQQIAEDLGDDEPASEIPWLDLGF